MGAQVANRLDAQRIGVGGAHAECIGVVEAERRGRGEAVAGQRIGQGVPLHVGVAEDFLKQRAGVLGIGVDVAAAEGLPQKPGAAELFAVRHREALGPHQVCAHPAQNDVFGELFGADGECRVGGLSVRRGREEGQNEEGDKETGSGGRGARTEGRTQGHGHGEAILDSRRATAPAGRAGPE